MNSFDQLLTQPSGSNVPPETLEMLGRQASQLFQAQGVSLNQAVSQILANHPELGNEHIKRVIEFANTVTFQEMFQASEDKNVHFEVADPGVILRDLKDGGSSAHSGTLNTDYQRPPQQQPGQGSPDVEAAFMQQFTGNSPSASEAVKVASVRGEAVDHEKHANPMDDAYDAMLRLQATREKLAESYERMDMLLTDTNEDFYQQVKAQVKDSEGSGLGGVIGALEKIGSSEWIETVLGPVAVRLVKEGYDNRYLARSLAKTAGAVPDLAHPLFASFSAIIKLAGEMVVCSQAIDDVDKMLEDIRVPFKKLAGALTTGVKNAIGPQGRVPAGIRQRFPKD